MTLEYIFYTQLASIIGFVVLAFTLYRLLVSQKDGVIELLKEKNFFLESKNKELVTKSPDFLVNALSERVDVTMSEINRLQEDGEEHKDQVLEKEKVLDRLRIKLLKLNTLLADNELLCPKCKSPLLRRHSHTIYGEVNGKEAEADIEYVEYECGYAIHLGEKNPISKCRSSPEPP